jgi:hypothetical protein
VAVPWRWRWRAAPPVLGVVAFCFPALTGRANLCRASGAGAAQADRVVGWFGLRGWSGANYNRALGFVAFSTYFGVNL